MNIYPYVYRGTHPVTGEFYIGSRQVNTIAAEKDLQVYRTSSKVVQPRFDEFNWEIVAEFFNRDSAYDFEQELINERWGDPLMLNKVCHFDRPRFTPHKGVVFSETHRARLSEAARNRSHTHVDNLRKSQLGRKCSPEHVEANRKAQTGKRMSDAARANMSKASMRPCSDESKEKISQKNLGKKRSPEARLKMSLAAKLRHVKKAPAEAAQSPAA